MRPSARHSLHVYAHNDDGIECISRTHPRVISRPAASLPTCLALRDSTRPELTDINTTIGNLKIPRSELHSHYDI
ncbi:hypothetical protein PUN28_012962 [Cardiocondyla obscurior]|uniref:Uncharacterized protein n=1 Tax=Cardiocondyla obscurior TaxID=286306 RepID=A0AAW2FA59_9HYME